MTDLTDKQRMTLTRALVNAQLNQHATFRAPGDASTLRSLEKRGLLSVNPDRSVTLTADGVRVARSFQATRRNGKTRDR